MSDVSDLSDMASVQEAVNLAEALAAASKKGSVKLVPDGSCYHCGDSIELEGALFCDRLCADAHAKWERHKAMNRVVQ